jgi:hypothetical protein
VRRVVLDMTKAPFLRNDVPAGGSAGDLSILLLTGRGEVVVCCGSEIDVAELPPELDPFPRRLWGEGCGASGAGQRVKYTSAKKLLQLPLVGKVPGLFALE